jgi:DNA-binding PadR family transcriptional regulator
MEADPRELEKRDAVLLDGLRAGLSGDEHRLYRSGKIEGLFAGKTGIHGEAAALAIREGLLEYSRTEARGRFEVEWVRLTAKGVEYLYQHDSPRAILGEMRQMLAVAQSGIPTWQDEMLQSLEKLATHITDQMAQYMDKLEALSKRIDEAMRRTEATAELSPAMTSLVPWGVSALEYLDHRRAGGGAGECPLPELFGAVRGKHSALTMREFHDGLRRLADNRAVKLSPWTGPGAIPQPEYAMMAEGKLMYLISR